jgi:hypothetical protein
VKQVCPKRGMPGRGLLLLGMYSESSSISTALPLETDPEPYWLLFLGVESQFQARRTVIDLERTDNNLTCIGGVALTDDANTFEFSCGPDGLERRHTSKTQR